MFTKIIATAALSCLSLSALAADSIDDEIRHIEQAKSIQATGSLAPIVGKSHKGHSSEESPEPISLKLFRGRSDGWWQAIVKMSDGTRISVNNEFTTIGDHWKVIGTKGNTLVVKGDKTDARQLFVDMQGETSVTPQSTTFSNTPGGIMPGSMTGGMPYMPASQLTPPMP